jgi:hypothetical protein
MMKISEFFEVFAANADGSHFIATVCLFTASQMDHKARAAFKPSCDCSRCLKPLLSCSYLSSVPARCVSSALKRCAAHLRANCAAAICSSARAPDMPPTNCANEKLNATASTVVEAACEHSTPVRMERNRESRASVKGTTRPAVAGQSSGVAVMRVSVTSTLPQGQQQQDLLQCESRVW